jgi:putative membrane protein
MSKTKLAALLAVLSLALASCSAEPGANGSDNIAVVNETASGSPGAAAAETRGQDFVSAVVGYYDFALSSARLAGERAERPDVKAFAQRLSNDIGDSRHQLTEIATAGQLKVDAAPGPTHQSDLAVLSSTRGGPLEKAFLDQQLSSLAELLGLVRAYKNGGDNPELKAWAEVNQTIVNDRLLEAQTLAAVIQEAEDK